MYLVNQTHSTTYNVQILHLKLPFYSYWKLKLYIPNYNEIATILSQMKFMSILAIYIIIPVLLTMSDLLAWLIDAGVVNRR